MIDAVITNKAVEIWKKKDADGGDVFEVSRKHFGKAGTFDIAGSEGGVYSSWETVLEKIKDLNLPPNFLDAAKRQLDSAGFAIINLPVD